VTELVSGGTLTKIIKAKDQISEKQAKHIVYQLLEAINYMHAKKLVHRDIKPDNILC
jgi:serine/threonine protein kinase